MEIEDAKEVLKNIVIDSYEWFCLDCPFKSNFDDKGFSCLNCHSKAVNVLLKRIEELERQVKIKDEYCQLLIDIGIDYDGYREAKSLMGLIDELMSYARYAIDNDDKRAIYDSCRGGEWIKTNILHEKVEEIED
jgi:hypothetical protein